MNFAVAAAVTAITLFIVSLVQRRAKADNGFLNQLILILRLLIFVFVGLYIYFRVTS